MKKFLSGVLCATLVFSLAISALAISGRMTIEVDPVNVQVNGEVFQPTDVTGKEVPVFAYQGTTYAPLRALAEAYGLEVGYDKAANMATVNDPDAKPEQPAAPDTTAKADYSDWSAEDEAAYQEFKGMWAPVNDQYSYQLVAENDILLDYIKTVKKDKAYSYVHRYAVEIYNSNTDKNKVKNEGTEYEKVSIWFSPKEPLKNENDNDMTMMVSALKDKVILELDTIWDDITVQKRTFPEI